MKTACPTMRTVGAPGIAAAALWMLVAAMPAHAEGALHRLMRPADAERLARFEQTRAAPVVSALGRQHGLTLQWIGWDRRGQAVVERRAGRAFMRGEQRSADGADYLILDGEIVDVDRAGFTLRGRIVTRVGFDNDGQPCVREGDLRFQAPPGRAYWRLQASRSPCSTLTDYIDVYF